LDWLRGSRFRYRGFFCRFLCNGFPCGNGFRFGSRFWFVGGFTRNGERFLFGLRFRFRDGDLFWVSGRFRGFWFCQNQNSGGCHRYRCGRRHGFSAGFAELNPGSERCPAMDADRGLFDLCSTGLAELHARRQWLVTVRAG